MGNWFETCAISHLPIQTGDEVMAFPIAKKRFIYDEWRAGGDNSKWYAPASLPIAAQCDSEESFVVQGDEEKTVYLRDLQQGKIENKEVMFVLREMYDTILAEMISRNGLYEKVRKMAEMVESELFEGQFFFMPKTRFDSFFWEEARTLRPLLQRYAETKDTALQEEMIHLFLFHVGLDIMRIPWHPGVGRGSQANEYFLWRKIGEKVRQKEQGKKEEWLEDNLLEEDQNEDDITKMYIWYI